MTRFSKGEDGFALLATLSLVAILSALATAVMVIARDDVREAVLARQLAEAKIAADNGIVRTIAALGNNEDPFHAAALKPNTTIEWSIDGVTLRVTVEHESGKIDLNRADTMLLAAGLRMFDENGARAERWLERINAFRQRGELIADFRQVLEPLEMLDGTDQRFARHFTIITGAQGIHRRVAGPAGLALSTIGKLDTPGLSANALAKMMALESQWRPIYTLRSRVVASDLPPLERRVGIEIRTVPLRSSQDLRVFFWE